MRAAIFFVGWLLFSLPGLAADSPARQTEVSIVGQAFHINGRPTYAGRNWKGHKIEGLLLNSRMVQGIFDDLNPEKIGRASCRERVWIPV